MHFAFTSIASLAVIGVALAELRSPSFVELLTVPLWFFVANAAEYFGHKGPMHRPRAGLGLVYRRHTLEHHRFFTNDVMSYDSPRDFKMVLFPPVMILFFLGAIAGPIGLGLFLVWGRNVGCLFVATAMGYFLTYEWLHFAYHLPASSFVGKTALVRTLRRHHQTHHDRALMGKHNFNITFPICDAIFGTTYRGDRQR
ncbi:MAG TPA: sterol desaturase family protein [Polyangiaceae bacterium]